MIRHHTVHSTFIFRKAEQMCVSILKNAKAPRVVKVKNPFDVLILGKFQKFANSLQCLGRVIYIKDYQITLYSDRHV